MRLSPPMPKPLVFALGLILAGCEVTATKQTLPELTFTHMAPINLAVSAVEVENRYRPASTGTYVEARFPTPPARAVERWAKDRLKPVGSGADGILRLIITEASVKETALKKDKSFKGVFTKQQSHRYDLSLRARLEVVGRDGRSKADAAAHAARSMTVREDLSLNEVKSRWLEETENLVKDFDREMERNLRQYLANWVR